MLFNKNKNLIDEYYQIDRRILREANTIYESLVFDFESVKVEKRDVGFLAILAHPLLKELQSYYNNELCITISMARAFVENCDKKDLISFHFENSIFRLVSFWDYSLSMLNEYLQFGFHTDSVSKQEARNYAGKRAVIETEGECNRLYFVDLDEEEKKEKQKQVNKIKIISKNAMFEKYNKEYYNTERLDKYFDLLNSEELQELQKIRNQIIHSRSLGTNMIVKFSNLHMKNAMSNSKKRWIDYNRTIDLLEANLDVINIALVCLTEIILLDEFPNSIDTKDRKFYMYDVECSKCGFSDRIPELMLDDKKTKICHSCWDNEMTVIEKLRTNEINHGSALYNYIKNFNSGE